MDLFKNLMDMGVNLIDAIGSFLTTIAESSQLLNIGVAYLPDFFAGGILAVLGVASVKLIVSLIP